MREVAEAPGGGAPQRHRQPAWGHRPTRQLACAQEAWQAAPKDHLVAPRQHDEAGQGRRQHRQRRATHKRHGGALVDDRRREAPFRKGHRLVESQLACTWGPSLGGGGGGDGGGGGGWGGGVGGWGGRARVNRVRVGVEAGLQRRRACSSSASRGRAAVILWSAVGGGAVPQQARSLHRSCASQHTANGRPPTARRPTALPTHTVPAPG